METGSGAASRLGCTGGRGRRWRGRRPGPRWQRGPRRRRAGSSSTQCTAWRLRAGAPAARPGRVQEQPPPLLQQLLALLPPPLLQLLPQPPPWARAPPAADPPLAAAPPPWGRGAAPACPARGRPARPQQPGARGALAAGPAPDPRRRRRGGLGAHFNVARSPSAGGAPRSPPPPRPIGALGLGDPSPDVLALCGGPVITAAPGTSQIRREAGGLSAPNSESDPSRRPVAARGQPCWDVRALRANPGVSERTQAGSEPLGSGRLCSDRFFLFFSFFLNRGVPLSDLIPLH